MKRKSYILIIITIVTMACIIALVFAAISMRTKNAGGRMQVILKNFYLNYRSDLNSSSETNIHKDIYALRESIDSLGGKLEYINNPFGSVEINGQSKFPMQIIAITKIGDMKYTLYVDGFIGEEQDQ